MHGSVCLLSKYLSHLFEGENLEELDISSASSSDNIFSGQSSLSTGWKGTCPLVNYFNNIYQNYTTEINSLTNILSSNHENLLSSYTSTNNLVNNLYTLTYITSTRPSGLSGSLLPKSEYEFSDKTNTSLIGGELYVDFTNKLKSNLDTLDGTIKTNINSYINGNSYNSNIESAYQNFINFDTAVATASNVMNNNMLDLRDYFLTLQFLLMFFTWAFMFFFGVIIVLYIIYAVKEYQILWYFIIVLVHILLVLMLVEIFLSSFFGQVRLICHEIPRAINFIFTGTYMVSGNSASYPAKFGTGNANMTKMFTTCLNGDGNLANLFLTSNDLSSLSNLQSSITSLYTTIKQIVDNSNVITNSYNNIQNSAFLKGIIKLETMKNNLFMATEGFGDDDIFNILINIRNNLDLANCSMTNEYYVIRASDCPSGSLQLTTIYNTTGVSHCYVIQNLASSAAVSYANSGCDNAYINTAIAFIKEIYNLIDTRLTQLKTLQNSYSTSYGYLYSEITSLSNKINSTYSIVNSNTESSSISNCGSVKFDLIDFCDFIGDTTEYDARILVIFTAFVGVFGYVMLYAFLVVLNSFYLDDNDYDDYEGYNYGKNKKKVRNINIKVNSARPIKRESTNYDKDEEEEDEDDYKKKLNNNNLKRGKTPPKTAQKIEMTNLSQNNQDSDSS